MPSVLRPWESGHPMQITRENNNHAVLLCFRHVAGCCLCYCYWSITLHHLWGHRSAAAHWEASEGHLAESFEISRRGDTRRSHGYILCILRQSGKLPLFIEWKAYTCHKLNPANMYKSVVVRFLKVISIILRANDYFYYRHGGGLQHENQRRKPKQRSMAPSRNSCKWLNGTH